MTAFTDPRAAMGPLFEERDPPPASVGQTAREVRAVMERISDRAAEHESQERRRAAFQAFHRANPEIYRQLVALARKARGAGVPRIGLRLLWERLRWDLTVETVRDSAAPKLNDWYPPFYARLILATEPDLAGFFETRERGERVEDPNA